jgi:formamidopyrimidine-DNA glycosylase
MPELPEVETVRRGLEPAMVGARFSKVEQRRPDLRFALPEGFATRLQGRRVAGLGRRAKYLLADLDGGDILVMHLGMSGSFRIDTQKDAGAPGEFHHPRSVASAHDHIVFEMSNGARITYNDSHPLFKGMGVEPLGNELDGALLARLFAAKSTPLKAALLDQRLIAGLGNIYVCEALHRAGLSPRRAAGTLARRNGTPTERARRLAEVIPQVLQEALAAGGSSLRDHRQSDGSLGYFQHRFRVYDREGAPCPTPSCTGTIKRIVQSGRSTFFCGVCQK